MIVYNEQIVINIRTRHVIIIIIIIIFIIVQLAEQWWRLCKLVRVEVKRNFKLIENNIMTSCY